MVLLQPKILEKDGKKEFAVFTYEEFLRIQEELKDFASLKALRDAKTKETDSETVSFAEAKKICGVS
jgi:hypothetical protein